MIPVVLALAPTPLAVRVVAGIVTYGIASLVLRTTSLADVRALAFGSTRGGGALTRRGDRVTAPHEHPEGDSELAERNTVSKRPATLLISPWTPYPLVFGGAIRVYSTIHMLSTFSDVTLLAYESWTDLPAAEVRAHLESVCEQVVLVPKKPHNSSVQQLRSMVSRKSYQQRLHHTGTLPHAIDEVTSNRQFSTIMVTSTPMGFFQIPERAPAYSTCTTSSTSSSCGGPATPARPERALMWLDGTKLRREELALCRQFDLVLTPSDRERRCSRPKATCRSSPPSPTRSTPIS